MTNLHLMECGFREKLEEMGIEKIIAHLYPHEMVRLMGRSELIEAILERDDPAYIIANLVNEQESQ